MKIRDWEDYDSLEEELAIRESRSKTYNKKKKKGYEKNEEKKRNKKTGKLWSNNPSRV
jgi:hypothetical protein|tara:strand:- start:341 stop:514 length:174 start_codon:yes stop_codon:yes gene_type:complete